MQDHRVDDGKVNVRVIGFSVLYIELKRVEEHTLKVYI